MRKSHYSLQNQVFLEMLKACRNERNLRQRDVASLLGRDQALVSKVESGERRLDVIELRTWVTAMGADFVGFVAELDGRITRTTAMSGSVFPSALPEARSPQATKGGSRRNQR